MLIQPDPTRAPVKVPGLFSIRQLSLGLEEPLLFRNYLFWRLNKNRDPQYRIDLWAVSLK